MHVLVMFGSGGGLLFIYVLLHDCVNVRVCNLHSLHYTGHIGSYMNYTLFIYDRGL